MQKKDDSQPKDSPTSRSQPAAIPKILIPATEGFRSPVDVAEALEEELHLQGKLPMRFLHSGQVLLSPPTQDLHDIIVNLRELKGRPIHLQTAQNNTTKGVLLRYPLLMPLSPILKNSLVLAAERFTTRDGEETRQVMITVRGTLPGSLDLGNWGTYYTRPYSKEPLRCFNCQKFGHHRANCTLAAKCGICAGRHDTKKCIQTHKEGGETTAKCPNCDLPHHAWNRKCLARREIVDVQRASQHQWMVKHRPTVTNSPAGQGRTALAATSTWGKRTEQPAAPHQDTSHPTATPTPDQFPALGAAASQPRTSSRPHQRINAPTHINAPPQQANHITLSKQDLQEMLQTFATALVSMLGKQIPTEDITTLTEKVVAKATKNQPAPQQQARNRSPSPRPRSPSPAMPPAPQANRGITPASANIAREKAALGLTQTQRNTPQPTTSTPTPEHTTNTTQILTTQATQTDKKQCKKNKDKNRRSVSCSGTVTQS